MTCRWYSPRAATRETPNHNLEFTHTHVFSPALMNQAQYSFTRREDIGDTGLDNRIRRSRHA